MMYRVWMVIDEENYEYGTYADRNKANEVAREVGYTRDVDTWVKEVIN